MLPKAMDQERVQLGFGREQTVWRVRDNGFVLSGGRGLPAIRTVKAMINRTEARIDSPNSRVDQYEEKLWQQEMKKIVA